MILWLIAALLGLATGLRIGWGMVNQQSVVSAAMIVALANLAVLAALNWPPLTLLVDSALNWPNISVGLSQVALVASAAGSGVMITSAASDRGPRAVRRAAIAQYGAATVIATVSLVLFLAGERQPEMSPGEYLDRNLASNVALPWLVPLLYVLFVMTLVTWLGMRLANPTRRGRALFLFSAGTALIVGACGFFLIRAVTTPTRIGVGTAATLLLCALAIVAAGSLLPTLEDWAGARAELRLIGPLQREMQRRHPDIGIGVRPRGPLVYRVAERLSLISDSLYVEAMAAGREAGPGPPAPPAGVNPRTQATAVARWVWSGRDDPAAEFPGRDWLSQPAGYSDREWILEIARQYRHIAGQQTAAVTDRVAPSRSAG